MDRSGEEHNAVECSRVWYSVVVYGGVEYKSIN